MSVIVLLIVAGGIVAAGFLAAFAWAVQSGQYDDTLTPAVRVLLEDGTRKDAKTDGRENVNTRRRKDTRYQEGRANADADY
jgi:cbb3-type cytochrome oxidase maturation protein